MTVSEPPSRSGITNSPSAGMKTRNDPATTPGMESGTVRARTPPARRAEILRGLDQGRLDPIERRVEWQDMNGR